MNERFAFTSSLAACIVIAYFIKRIQRKYYVGKPQVIYGIFAAILLAFSFKTISRVPVWENALTLNSAAIKVSKNSARANSFMSTALFEEYKITSDRAKKEELLNQAAPYVIKALSIYPNYYNGNLMRAGIAAEKYKLDRNLENLLAEFFEVSKSRPDVDFLTEYLNYLNDRADINTMNNYYINVGRTLIAQRKNVTWAVHYLLMGNNLDPNNPDIKSLLVQGYTLTGRPEDAAKFQ